MYSQYRVDVDNISIPAKVLEGLHKTRKVEEFFLSEEISTIVGKVHIQGWSFHNMKDNTYRVGMAKPYKDGLSSSKCFTKIDKPIEYKAYIIKNKDKGATKETIETVEELVHLKDYRTSLSNEELVILYNSLPFYLSKEEFKTKEKEKKKTSSTSFFDRVLQQCILEATYKNIKGEVLIDYKKIFTIYCDNCPKQLDNYLLERNINGVTNKLEKMFPHKENRKLRVKLRQDHAESRYGDVYH